MKRKEHITTSGGASILGTKIGLDGGWWWWATRLFNIIFYIQLTFFIGIGNLSKVSVVVALHLFIKDLTFLIRLFSIFN